MKRFFLMLSVISLVTVGVSGCATAPQSLYYWGDYQAQVYEGFKGETSQEEQIHKLEETQAKAASAGKPVPPGFNAHVGFLYGLIGRADEMVSHFSSEKKLFPESAVYIDFLMLKKPIGKGE